jgi:signal transduction histidine kinase
MSAAAVFLAGAGLGAILAAAAAKYSSARRAARNGRLFSFALHEINTPVTAVNMTLINLASGVFGPVPADQARWLEMSRDQIARLGSIVGELRDLVHLEFTRDLSTTPEKVDVAELVGAVALSLRGGFAASGAALEQPGPAAAGAMFCDRDRAARSLESLLYHARKFRLSGPVTLTAVRDAGFVRLSVAYVGPAMSPAEARESLDVFYPAQERRSHTLSSSGAGLGLVRAVSVLDGGDLQFTVDPTGRSILTLSLPATEA